VRSTLLNSAADLAMREACSQHVDCHKCSSYNCPRHCLCKRYMRNILREALSYNDALLQAEASQRLSKRCSHLRCYRVRVSKWGFMLKWTSNRH